jgi:rhomboid family GlyGly-CTERM serine protease
VSARAHCEAGGAGLCPAPPWLTLLLAAVAGGVALLPDGGAGLAYRRDLVAAGELWRLITGHFVHWSPGHLMWDVGTFLVLGAACELRSRKRLLSCVLVSMVAIPGAIWLLLPRLELCAGLSGIDSALFALLGAELVRERSRRRSALVMAFALALGLGFALKIGFEVTNGATVFVSDLAPGIVPVPLAHLAGGAVGLLAALAPGDPTRELVRHAG